MFTATPYSLVVSREARCSRWLGHYLLTTLGTKNKPLQHLISQVLKGLISERYFSEVAGEAEGLSSRYSVSFSLAVGS